MQKHPVVVLHSNKANAVKRFHPWVFSGAIKSKDGNPEQGDVVEVLSEKGEFLGLGHFSTGSIAVRIFSFKKSETLEEIWREKFRQAFALRKTLGLTENQQTNAYRLINAEGDGMPGLVVDWYNGTAVVQCHHKGMNAQKEIFTELLKEGYGSRLQAVYDKSAATLHHKPDHTATEHQHTDSYLYGSATEKLIVENGHQFAVDWEGGQKTGFFIDQRDNRQLLHQYVHGKKVLNTFCYSGGFSVYAAKGGAHLVHSVDSSANAIQLTNQNMLLNHSASTHQAFVSDVFDFMKNTDESYDIIVLDPPAFAKSQSARHNAIQAYTRLNQTAFNKIKKGGLVFTFSCSQAVNPEMFSGAVTSAAISSRRNVRVLHHLTQPADHPVSIYCPEGLYLKGLVLHVE